MEERIEPILRNKHRKLASLYRHPTCGDGSHKLNDDAFWCPRPAKLMLFNEDDSTVAHVHYDYGTSAIHPGPEYRITGPQAYEALKEAKTEHEMQRKSNKPVCCDLQGPGIKLSGETSDPRLIAEAAKMQQMLTEIMGSAVREGKEPDVTKATQSEVTTATKSEVTPATKSEIGRKAKRGIKQKLD